MHASCKFLAWFSMVLIVGSAVPIQKLNMQSPMPQLIRSANSSDNSSAAKTQLKLAAIINYSGFIQPIGPICTESMRIALDAVEKSSTLKGYQLVIEPFDDMCMRPVPLRTMVDIASNLESENRLPLVLGPMCSGQADTGAIAKYYNYNELAAVSNVPEVFTNRQLYSSFFSLSPSSELLYDAIPLFLQRNGWKKVYLLTETLTYWKLLEEKLARNLDKVNISIAGTSKIITPVGSLPTPDQFERGVSDLAAQDPRVVIVDTSYSVYLACWLHRYNVFGPHIVLLFFGPIYFLPNDPLRPPGCTEEMLFEVLQSIIFFSAAPAINIDPNKAIDWFGTKGSTLEDTLKSRVDHPDALSVWIFWRALCYDHVAAAALLLDSVERQLAKSNDTLGNWFTSGEKFRTNGSYIHSLISSSLTEMVYRGLGTNGKGKPNSRVGPAGFFQMQTRSHDGEDLSLSARLNPVPIAFYDSSLSNAALQEYEKNYAWRTRDGQAPSDSLQIFHLNEPLLKQTADISTKASCGTVILATLVLLVLNSLKSHRSIGEVMLANLISKVNALILIGNIFVLSFPLIVPTDGKDRPHAVVGCMTACLCLVFGFSLSTFCFLAKMQVAFKTSQLIKKTPRRSNLVHVSDLARTIVDNTMRANKIEMRPQSRKSKRYGTSPSYLKRKSTDAALRRYSKRALIAAPCWALFQTLIMAAWFSFGSMKYERFNRQLEFSTMDKSVAFQRFTFACSLNSKTGSVSTTFITALLISYFLIFFRSCQLAIYLRNVKASSTAIKDFHLVRSASYSSGIIGYLGGGTIAAFFSSDPYLAQAGISVLLLAIIATTTGIIYIPKLVKKGIYC